LTLDSRQTISAFGELVKYGLISGGDFWEQLPNLNFELIPPFQVIEQCLETKKAIILEDPYEKSSRKILNLGHTIGHALESYALDQHLDLMHGEAVAAGIVLEGIISRNLLGFSEVNLDIIKKLASKIYPRIKIEPDHFDNIIHYIRSDKKNYAGAIQFTLVEKPGKVVFDIPVEEITIRSALEEFFKK